MNSRRQEERNEKIIRGLMKLPPNRRCINCNSLGPQYVCTNFWTFVCTTCSGIHREFTHRVKSVSMAKFTSQEVDALQKGGNQRAKELFLQDWDLQRNRLPDNSNVDKLRQFIKNVYIDKKYTLEKPSDRPPRDPQSLRTRDDETRRASSYHSYSQSPPYDFQYEEQHYGKHAPGLTRRVGSDHGLYNGKLAGFLSPTHSSDDGFASEGSFSRASDYSASGGGDAFRSDFFSPSPSKDAGSPFSDTSREMSSNVPHPRTVIHDSDAKSRSNEGRISRQQRTASSGSLGSFDGSSTFKSVNSLGLPEAGSEPAHPTEDTLHKSLSLPSLPQSSVSGNFSGLDLFSAPFTSQSVTSGPPTGSNSQLQPVSSAKSQPQSEDMFAAPSQQRSEIPHTSPMPQSPSLDLFAVPSEQHSILPQTSQMPQPPPVDLFDTLFQHHSGIPQTSHTPQRLQEDLFSSFQQQTNISQPPSLDFFSTSLQQLERSESSQIPRSPPLDLFAALPRQQPVASPSGDATDVVMPGNGGWATFDTLQNMSMGTKTCLPATVVSSDGNTSGSFNPFSVYQSSSYQDSVGHKTSAFPHALGPENLRNVEVTISNTDLWSAFNNFAGGQINPDVPKSDEQAAVHCASDASKSLSFGAYETLNNDGNASISSHVEPPSSVPSHLNTTTKDFPIDSAVGDVHPLATDHKPINPFDLPYDLDMESSNTSKFWEMSTLQATLPNSQMPASDGDGVNESWFPRNSVPSYGPGGVPFDPTSGSLGFMAGKAPPTQIPNIHHAQGPVAASSVGGNPFA